MEYFDLPKDKTFLVSNKAVIEKREKILILRVSAESSRLGNWELPGGLLNWGEDLASGLIREVKEETSLDISPGSPIAVSNYSKKGFIFKDGRVLDIEVISIGYLCKGSKGKIKLSWEHDKYTWVSKGDLCKYSFDDNSKEIIAAYLGRE